LPLRAIPSDPNQSTAIFLVSRHSWLGVIGLVVILALAQSFSRMPRDPVDGRTGYCM